MSGTPLEQLMKAAKDPAYAYQTLRTRGQGPLARAMRLLLPKDHVGTEQNRSESDNSFYLHAVRAATSEYKAFSTFKRDPHYRTVLEHVTRAEGQAYLDVLRKDAPDFLDDIEKFKINDLIGSPYVFSYPGIGTIGPTTLRYMKVASDLRKLFGADLGGNIAEIGVGYGGQMLVNDRAFSFRRCDLFDLAPVLSLVERYLESHVLNNAYHPTMLNQHLGGDAYDLVISNYAFSELPSQLERKYIEKVLSNAKRGYLTMNSGRADSRFTDNKLSVEELRELLPPFDILPEIPLSCPGNYIIVWGHGGTGAA